MTAKKAVPSMVQMRTTNRAWIGETFQAPNGTYLVQKNCVLVRVGQVRTPGGGTRWSTGRNQPGVVPEDAAWFLDQPGGKRNWQVEKGVALPAPPVEVAEEPTVDTAAIVAELAERRAHLDGRAAALDERETRLHETEAALDQRSASLDDREAGILRRERDAGFVDEPTGAAEGDNSEGGVEDPKAPVGNLVELPPEAPEALADGTKGTPSEEEGEFDALAAELEANSEPAVAEPGTVADPAAYEAAIEAGTITAIEPDAEVEFEPAAPPPPTKRKAPPVPDKADLDVLDLSIAKLTDALATGEHDSFLMALTNAEQGGKTRRGALEALDDRRREVAKAAREGATS